MEVSKEELVAALKKWGISDEEASAFWDDLSTKETDSSEDPKGSETDSNVDDDTTTSEDGKGDDDTTETKNEDGVVEPTSDTTTPADSTPSPTPQETLPVEPAPTPAVSPDEIKIISGQLAEVKQQMAEVLTAIASMSTSTPVNEDINGNPIGSKTQGASPNAPEPNNVQEDYIKKLGGRA